MEPRPCAGIRSAWRRRRRSKCPARVFSATTRSPALAPKSVEVQNASALVTDDEEAVEYAEGECGDGEEIHRGDGFLVVTQKGKPALARPRILPRSIHPPRNGSFRNVRRVSCICAFVTGGRSLPRARDRLSPLLSNFGRRAPAPDGAVSWRP